MEKILADRIKDAQLTKNERKIANYFLKNQSEICFMSTNELAKILDTSDTSIIRFARALGYSGFNDMQRELQKQVSNHINNNGLVGLSLSQRLNHVKQSTFKEGAEGIIKEVFSETINNLNTSVGQNASEKYKITAQMLAKAKHKYIIGFRGAKGVCIHFARTLRYIIDDVIEVTTGDTYAFELLRGIGPDDVAIIVSFARYGKADCIIREMLVERNVKFCVITDKAFSPVAKNANILLLTETKGLSFFNSVTSTMFLMELILTLTAEEMKTTVKNNLDEVDKYLTEFFVT